MNKPIITEDWKNWIADCMSRGSRKSEVFYIMLDRGFAYDDIQSILQYDPARDLQPPPELQCELNIPGAKRYPSDLLALYTLENFLSPQECAHVIGLIRSDLRDSVLATSTPSVNAAFRTSRTCYLEYLNDPTMHDIDRRICALVGLTGDHSESIQGQYYEVGQEYKAHRDYFEPYAPEYNSYAGKLGQRCWTVMVYLNDTPKGGGTRFPNVGHTFYPKQGMAVIWNSLHPSGMPNPDSLHQAMPVEEGSKAVITKWFRVKVKYF